MTLDQLREKFNDLPINGRIVLPMVDFESMMKDVLPLVRDFIWRNLGHEIACTALPEGRPLVTKFSDEIWVDKLNEINPFYSPVCQLFIIP